VEVSESRSRSRSSQLSSNRSNSNPSDNVSGISAKSSPDAGDSSDDFLINSDDYPKISARYVHKEGPSSDSETDPINKEDRNTKSSYSETDSSSRINHDDESNTKANSNPQIRRTSSIGDVNRYVIQNSSSHQHSIRNIESRSASEYKLKYKGVINNNNKSTEEIHTIDDKTKENSIRRRSINDRASLSKIRREKDLQAPDVKHKTRKEKQINVSGDGEKNTNTRSSQFTVIRVTRVSSKLKNSMALEEKKKNSQ